MRKLIRAIGLCYFAMLAWIVAPGAAVADDGFGFVVVVNEHNTISSMSRAELKRAATGTTKQWDSGAVIQLGINPGDAPETQYLASLLEMTPRELLARIEEQVFKGEMRRPAVLRSSADCIAFARAVAGAFCVASAQSHVPPEAHVVTIR
jgi:hypothetical protein